jgi:hypothetical protein
MPIATASQARGAKTQKAAEHGGVRKTGRRKIARPLATHPGAKMLITFNSRRAKGKWSLKKPEHARWIQDQVGTLAKRFGVKVHQLENRGDALELLLSARTREAYQGFLRTLSGTVARQVTGARKGNPVGRFWDGLAHSRVVA